MLNYFEKYFLTTIKSKIAFTFAIVRSHSLSTGHIYTFSEYRRARLIL